MKIVIYQYYFWILNLKEMYYHQSISYSIAKSAPIHPLLNHNLNFLPPKQQLNLKPRLLYQS